MWKYEMVLAKPSVKAPKTVGPVFQCSQLARLPNIGLWTDDKWMGGDYKEIAISEGSVRTERGGEPEKRDVEGVGPERRGMLHLFDWRQVKTAGGERSLTSLHERHCLSRTPPPKMDRKNYLHPSPPLLPLSCLHILSLVSERSQEHTSIGMIIYIYDQWSCRPIFVCICGLDERVCAITWIHPPVQEISIK